MTLSETLLESILSTPSSPFREKHIVDLLTKVLSENNVPHFKDPVGNLVVGAANKKDYLKILNRRGDSEPTRIFIAHMDHPGFHGARWRSETELEVKWHGGSPTAFIEGSRVWLSSREQKDLGYGEFIESKLIPSGRALESGVVRVPAGLKKIGATQIFGGFGFRAPVWREGDLYYTKAADDLVGSFAIVSLALQIWGGSKKGSKKRKKTPPFIGLLTRAEEVGFIGAIGHFELGWVTKAKAPVLCVSLETSRTLPGADIGKGPVIRLGDRSTVFTSSALQVFTALAAKQMPDRYQRRVMDGGSCEATAATAYGLPCVGISVPLGNYHNMNLEGGPDAKGGPMGPAPEFVHRADIEGLLDLCGLLMTPKQKWDDPWAEKRKGFKKEYRGYRELLKTGP